IRVPQREIRLSGGEAPLRVYDTSGPLGVDVYEGLPALRDGWIRERDEVVETERSYRPISGRSTVELPPSLARRTLRGTGSVTQLYHARRGQVTPEMEFIAIRE